ncbi:MAG: dipicolinate synthase subunit B, partial [Acutalibacteraceae bacterium]
KAMRELTKDYDVIPIMSEVAFSRDTRFGKAEYFIEEIENITGKKVIKSIEEAEPIGPKKMCDLLVVAPCTGNTAAKIANGITDTSVTMAVKSHMRILRPVLLAIASNDGLGVAAVNIGKLLNRKNVYLTPMSQDDVINKPNSLVADFDKIPLCIEEALKGIQHRPVFI